MLRLKEFKNELRHWQLALAAGFLGGIILACGKLDDKKSEALAVACQGSNICYFAVEEEPVTITWTTGTNSADKWIMDICTPTCQTFDRVTLSTQTSAVGYTVEVTNGNQGRVVQLITQYQFLGNGEIKNLRVDN